MSNINLSELIDPPALFSENGTPSDPLSISAESTSSSKPYCIPLREQEPRPKIVIVDDDVELIAAMRCTWEQYYQKALDIRYWQPTNELDLLAYLKDLKEQENWQVDIVVIDMNLATGGKSGVQFLADLRNEKGYAALPVVLATGNHYSDKPSVGSNKVPEQWLSEASEYEPTGILYRKDGNAQFLGRIGEHITDWQRVARRRAWVSLLKKVSKELDGHSVRVEDVGNVIVDFVVAELGVDHAFVRQRMPNGFYKLVAKKSPLDHVELQGELHLKDVPLLAQIIEVDETRHLRDPVNTGIKTITEEDAGKHPCLIGKYFLGIGAVLGDRNAGFITLLRDPGHPKFAKEDEPYLAVLARLLASALRMAFLRDMQTGLLLFAQKAALAKDDKKVCTELAKMLHKELHHSEENEKGDSKTTVRLLDFATGELNQYAKLGLAVKNTAIFWNTPNSNYANVVSTNKFIRIRNVQKLKETEIFLETAANMGVIHSELCVPLSIGESAIGAINLEHKSVDFYRGHDVDFVQAAATLAANAIDRVRELDGKNALLKGMTEFLCDAIDKSTEYLQRQLLDSLYRFCSFTVFVDLELHTTDDNSSWHIRNIEPHEDCDKDKLRSELERCCLNPEKWGQTWASRLIKDAKPDEWAWFTADKNDLHDMVLTANAKQKAAALLLIRENKNAPPHRAFLLMWAFPPPMNAVDSNWLGNLARLFSELDKHLNGVQTLIQGKLMSEQAVGIAHVMQHFRHRLGSLTSGQSTQIDMLKNAYEDKDDAAFQCALMTLRANTTNIANSIHKSRAYIKEPEIKPTAVYEIINKACEHLERLQEPNVRLTIDVDKQLMANSDIEIASLVLYSLLENALDACKDQATVEVTISAMQVNQHIALRVQDNGKGVAISFRPLLFQWGKTTKTEGLGSALSFARTRMELMAGKLVFPLPQPNHGAVFEMQLALPITENNHHD